jgi:hypothetical protein
VRRKFTDADRQGFFAELERSGESTWKVAQRLGITTTTAYRWVGGRRREVPTFVRVVRSRPAVEPERQADPIIVAVGSARIAVEHGFDAALLRAVVEALAEVKS